MRQEFEIRFKTGEKVKALIEEYKACGDNDEKRKSSYKKREDQLREITGKDISNYNLQDDLLE
jgi:hypothetical protein